MERARAAAGAAFLAVLLTGTIVLAGVPAVLQAALAPAAAVGWPSSTLVVSEVQTGGASASDEFAEISNTGSSTVDLSGLEIVYATSTGGTVTRKVAWTSTLLLEPGRHFLIANSSGVFAAVADAVYSSGFAATGGAIVLRAIGGAPIDALGWGDATNGFVEGAAAPAPAAGASLERRPGGLSGNTVDTNDNLADFFAQAAPNPQNLAAPPVPAPGPTATPAPDPTPGPSATPETTIAPTLGPSPTPTPTSSASSEPTLPPSPDPTPTVAPSPSLEPTATPQVTPSPTSSPTPEPTPTPTPSPTPEPTLTPTPSPTPEPTPNPTAAPTATPSSSPSPVTIAAARTLPDGTAAVVVGTLTTDLGALEAGRSGFVQDTTAGIAVYLDATLAPTIPAGTRVRLEGTLDERYGARTLRVATSSILDIGFGPLPVPVEVGTGAVGEAVEGRRVIVTGITSGSPTTYADGLGILVNDGSGVVRVIVGPNALNGAALTSGVLVRATGPVGQRDSSGTGLSGYRIHPTGPGELELLPPPPTPEPTASASPSPSPEPSATADPTGSPEPTPTAAPSPDPSPAPSASPSPSPAITIAEARTRSVGSVVSVTGVVTAEAGRIGTPSLLAIGDATGGILVRVPDGAPAPARGARLSVTGKLADPYGQLEVRPAAGGFEPLGAGTLPVAVAIGAADLDEGTEGRLVSLVGTVTSAPRKSTSGDLTTDLIDPTGTPFRVLTDASSGLTSADIRVGTTYGLVGIVGQRASKKGALDGYRVWLRGRADVTAGPSAPSGAAPFPSAGGPLDAVLPIVDARRLDDAPATVEGVVTAGAGLLDADGRRIVIQDATAGIEVYLPSDLAAPAPGARIRVEGTVGRAWGAPRLHAATVTDLGVGAAVRPRSLNGAPSEATEWQLVRVAGAITDVTRLGDRWRADVRVGGETILVTGLSGAKIASTLLVEGRSITVVGIARRPYPTATDRRWTVLPRGAWDVALGPATTSSGLAGARGRDASSGSEAGRPAPGATGAGAAVRTVDLAALGEHVGEVVRVGGLVAARTPRGVTLDDGTALSLVELRGDVAAFLDLIEAGDALGILGRVEVGDGGDPIVVASDPAGLVRLGSLGEAVPLAADVRPSPSASSAFRPLASAGLADPIRGVEAGWLGVVGLVLLSSSSFFLKAVRRRRAHRLLVNGVARRLAGLRRSSGAA